ncbi:endonuclease/exonuclease/phosphatase family protein [Salinactinospora qingdaonensis]|uniref:Endonuclease/exonuclease/phosphatase family protein n=1 Tax=Salinactinospora qingdaonensis TaxID=702744 RepID=A0ABP7FTB3_9ACTN
MRSTTRTLALLTALATTLTLMTAPAAAEYRHGDHGHHHGGHGEGHGTGHGAAEIRFATFNASLNRASAGELAADLATGTDTQAHTVAEIIQRVRPDVLLLNEFDYDARGRAAELFQEKYLSVPHEGAAGIDYRYRYTAPSNTGIASGFDLDNDGVAVTEPETAGYGDDAFGFGAFPGQYGMVVYSRYPIATDKVRTFQKFRWADMPDALLPTAPDTGEPFYSAAELARLRLSSKSHWDIPIRAGRGRSVHLLASHPTPPSFDGPEQRNVKRNHDEIRFWADYVRPWRAGYIYDDEGQRGGLHPGAAFVVAGDLNADPNDGDGHPDAIAQLLDSRRVNSAVVPTSAGGAEAAQAQQGANTDHTGAPAQDTADFADTPGPGNLRVDYVLPSRGLAVRDAGVFWPTSDDPLSRLTGSYPFPSSDHRLVWLDLHRR